MIYFMWIVAVTTYNLSHPKFTLPINHKVIAFLCISYQIYIDAHNALYTKKEVVHTIYAQPPRTQTFNN